MPQGAISFHLQKIPFEKRGKNVLDRVATSASACLPSKVNISQCIWPQTMHSAKYSKTFTMQEKSKAHQSNYMYLSKNIWLVRYSKIPIIRPPLKLSKSGLKDHFWTVPKVVSNQMYTGCRK